MTNKPISFDKVLPHDKICLTAFQSLVRRFEKLDFKHRKTVLKNSLDVESRCQI